MKRLWSLFVQIGLLASLLSFSFLSRADLPKEGFPLGRAGLPEVRTVKELRPGLTHVHVERGGMEKRDRPKFTFLSVQHDLAGRDAMRACLERAGYAVREEVERKIPDAEPRYVLTAGEFDSLDELKKTAREIPCVVQFTELFSGERPDGEIGPYVLDIVILDPQVYRGKIVSTWSGNVWRASPLELALRHNAVVGINGSWFEYSIDEIAGVPSGISIVQGLWHHEPHPKQNRAAMLFIENTDEGPKLSIGYDAPPVPELKWSEGKNMRLDGIDRMVRENEIVAMKEPIFMNSAYSHDGLPKHVASALVSEASTGEGYYILATGGKRRIVDDYKSTGNPIGLDLSVPGRPALNAFYTANSLIIDGQLTPRDHHGRVARTAIGANAEGKIYLIVSYDGNGASWESVGLSLNELRDIGSFLGLVNFANLDGGPRSTSMVIEGKAVGDPDLEPYNEARRVADVILVVDDE